MWVTFLDNIIYMTGHRRPEERRIYNDSLNNRASFIFTVRNVPKMKKVCYIMNTKRENRVL